jgi:hypothetical protein
MTPEPGIGALSVGKTSQTLLPKLHSAQNELVQAEKTGGYHATIKSVRLGVYPRGTRLGIALVGAERASVPHVRITIRLGLQLDRLYYDRFRGKLLIFDQYCWRNLAFEHFAKTGPRDVAKAQQIFLRVHIEGWV